MIIRRTFEATNHKPGSTERARLNLDPVTSEYYPSKRYIVRGPGIECQAETKRQALSLEREMSK